MNPSKYNKKMIIYLLDILFPTKCLGCGAKSEILCEKCVQMIRPAERETEEKIIAVFDYRDPVIKKAIWELKYHHKRYLGDRLGELLYEYLMEEISEMKTTVPGRSIYVVPVPVSNKKMKKRGYNQSLYIAKGFCSCGGKEIFELKNKIIWKSKETLPQAKITNRKRRLENVRGVFDIKNSECVKGRTIIVIDDVTTTGGTISEIIKVLKKAGAKRVVGFAVAH
jgi:ComF family protein